MTAATACLKVCKHDATIIHLPLYIIMRLLQDNLTRIFRYESINGESEQWSGFQSFMEIFYHSLCKTRFKDPY